MKKTLLVESFSSWGEDVSLNRIDIKNKIVEADGKEFKPISAYEVPIWRLNKENLNKRTYTARLAEKVIGEGKVTFALADHPEDNEGSVRNIVAVGKNPHIRESVMYADAYFVDEEFHKKIEKILEYGAGLGVSSSGYGEIDDNGNVIEESYELERYFDFVMNPSYGVSLSKESKYVEAEEKGKDDDEDKEVDDDSDKKDQGEDKEADEKDEACSKKNEEEDSDDSKKDGEDSDDSDKETDKEDSKSDSKEKEDDDEEDDKKKEESVKTHTNIVVTKLGSNTMKTNKPLLSIEEKNLRLGVANLFEKAEKKESLKEKLEAYQEILSYCEGIESAGDYVVKATEEIAKLEDELFALEEKQGVSVEKVERISKNVTKLNKEKATVKEELAVLKRKFQKAVKALKKTNEKYGVAVNLLDNMKVREGKLKEMYTLSKAEKNGMVTAKEHKETYLYAQKLEKDLKKARIALSKAKSSRKKSPVVTESTKSPAPNRNRKRKTTIASKRRVSRESVRRKQDVYGNYDAVHSYYEDLLEENPNVYKIKEEILRCKTLIEAQKTYLNLLDLVEAPHRPSFMSESVSEFEKEAQTNGTYEPSILKLGHRGWD